MSPIVLSLLLLSVLLSLVYWWKRKRLLKLAANLPGPPTVPIFGNALEFRSKDLSQNFRTFVGFMRKYGPVIRIWLGPQLITAISDPHHIAKLVAHDKFCTRGPFFRIITKSMFRNGLLAIDGEIWKKHRKIVTAAFQNNILDKYVGSFATHSCILADRLNHISDGKFHDIYMHFSQCTLDVICDTVFGYKLNAQANNKTKVVNCVTGVLDHLVAHLVRPWLHFDLVHKLTKSCVKYTDAVEHLNNIMIDSISLRKEKHKQMQASGEDIQLDKMKNPLLLDTLILNEDLNMDDILGEISSIAGAGAETTSSTCCFVLALLCEHQHIQEKVLEEQKAVFGDDIQRPVTRDDLPQMLYLEQVIKETLRLYSPLSFHYRQTMDNVDLGNGCVLPAGIPVIVTAYLTHRNPDYFPDPERFDPDRFLPENSVGRHPYAYIPFGLGRRLCVGHNYAMMETKTILSTVLRKYRACAVEGGIRALEKSVQFGLIQKPADGFRISMVPRCTA